MIAGTGRSLTLFTRIHLLTLPSRLSDTGLITTRGLSISYLRSGTKDISSSQFQTKRKKISTRSFQSRSYDKQNFELRGGTIVRDLSTINTRQ